MSDYIKNDVEQIVSYARHSALQAWVLLFFLVVGGQSFAENDTWVVLGDSISSGYGIPEGKGWVNLLQKKLQDSGKTVQIVNESISGDTTAGGVARLPGVLDRLKPSTLLIELGGNDGLRGLSTKAMEANFSNMITLCQERNIDVMILGMKIPPNYGRKYGEMFEGVFVSVSERFKIPLLPFLLEGIGGYQDYMQGDRIHPNVDAQEVLAKNVWRFLQTID